MAKTAFPAKPLAVSAMGAWGGNTTLNRLRGRTDLNLLLTKNDTKMVLYSPRMKHL